MMARRDLKAIRIPSGFLGRRPAAPQTSGADRTERPGPAGPPLIPSRPVGRNLWLMVWLVVVVVAAQLALFIAPIVGVYVNALAFASLMYLALRHERARQLVIAVAIIPVSMLVGLSLPEATTFQRVTAISVVVLLLGLIYQYLFTLDYPLDGSRMRNTRHGYAFAMPLMIVLGQLIGLIGFGLLFKEYAFRDSPLVLVLLGAVIFAVSEEVLFRGLIQQRAMILFNPIVAAVLSGVLYTSVTFGHSGGVLSPIVGACIGAATSIVYYRKQNILLTIAINGSAKLTYFALIAVFVLR